MTRARDLAAFVSNADGDIKFDTDTLFIDSSANRVGIGTTTPSEQINLVGSSGASKIRFDGDSSNLQNNFIGITGYDDLIIASDEANSGTASTIQFKVDSTERMRIDSNGSVGIGVTPDTSSTPSIQIGSGVINNISNYSSLSENSYYNGGWKYVSTAGSSLYQAKAGTHYFFQAASGTADTSITYNEKIRIDGDGLKFNGDTAAANALSDYEEGTGTFGVASGTMSGNSYTYTKIGRLCYVQSVISGWSDYTSGNSLELTGLPFTATTTGHAAGSSMANLNSSGKHIAYINGSNRILFYHSNTGSGYSNLLHSELPSSGSIHLFLTYQTT